MTRHRGAGALLIAIALLTTALSCTDRQKEVMKCSAICDELDKESRAYCTESDPSGCFAELDDATARCKERCGEQVK